MQSNNKLTVQQALDGLQKYLYTFFDQKIIQKSCDESYLEEITNYLDKKIKEKKNNNQDNKNKENKDIALEIISEDLRVLLKVIDEAWDKLNPLLKLKKRDRGLIIELLTIANKISHKNNPELSDLSLKETERALDTILLLLSSIKFISKRDNHELEDIEKYIANLEKTQEEIDNLQYQERTKREILDKPVSDAEEEKIKKWLSDLLEIIPFKKTYLLKQALTHRSYKFENPNTGEDNEQLEFLGDAILTFLTGEFLYKKHRNLGEGKMTILRSNLVSNKQLAKFAEELNLRQWMLLGKGETDQQVQEKDSLLSNSFEAVIGAYYLDSGIEAVRNFVNPFFQNIISDLLTIEEDIFKIKAEIKDTDNSIGKLQEWLCFRKIPPAVYKEFLVSGTPHEPIFTYKVYINNEEYGEGQGSTKKDAKKKAAENALKKLNSFSENKQSTI